MLCSFANDCWILLAVPLIKGWVACCHRTVRCIHDLSCLTPWRLTKRPLMAQCANVATLQKLHTLAIRSVNSAAHFQSLNFVLTSLSWFVFNNQGSHLQWPPLLKVHLSSVQWSLLAMCPEVYPCTTCWVTWTLRTSGVGVRYWHQGSIRGAGCTGPSAGIQGHKTLGCSIYALSTGSCAISMLRCNHLSAQLHTVLIMAGTFTLSTSPSKSAGSALEIHAPAGARGFWGS